MRVIVLRTDDTTYRFIWSFHHILMDGWCLPLITKEIFDHYFALLQQKQPEQAAITPYSQYIEWLDRQDAEEAKRYWDQYLEGYEEQTVLLKDSHQAEDEHYFPEKVSCAIDTDLTLKMKQTASKHHVTLNTLLQTAWGFCYRNIIEAVTLFWKCCVRKAFRRFKRGNHDWLIH